MCVYMCVLLGLREECLLLSLPIQPGGCIEWIEIHSMRCVNQKQLLGAGLQLSTTSPLRHVSQLSGSLGHF